MSTWIVAFGLALGFTWSLLGLAQDVNNWIMLLVYCLALFLIFPLVGVALLIGLIWILERNFNF